MVVNGALRTLACVAAIAVPTLSGAVTTYDLVLANGRVIDPASGLDAVRNVAVSDGRIVAISAEPLNAREVVDARGLVVAPGFIDIHSHAQDARSNLYQAHDGVTTALEMEAGVASIDEWYRQRAGKMVTNYGATISHSIAHTAAVRGVKTLESLADPLTTGQQEEARQPVSPERLPLLAEILQQGLDEGALGVGMLLQYLPGVDRREVLRTFQTAAGNGAPIFAHSRNTGILQPDSVSALQELLADAAATGATVHMAHVGSSGLRQTPLMIEMIDAARSRGIDITTEVYPYDGAVGVYGSVLLRGPWRENFGIDYDAIQDGQTGARLTEQTFLRGRAQTPDAQIIVHLAPQEAVDAAVVHPSVMIASDAVGFVGERGHPRTAGTFSRVLGVYVRERKSLTLSDALAKMTIMPARRLERYVPQMAHKGRIEVGADADITVFDPATVIDRATYERPAQFSQGIVHVLVGGTFVVKSSATVVDTLAGKAVRRTPHRSVSAAEVERFADSAMAELMKHTWAPGASVAIVQGDQLLLAKGYGWADEAGKTPVDGERTLFRVGSVTKVLTSVAAMKLVEQGRLDLDADVNQYLTAARIPATFPEAVTPRRLMSHRGGFETFMFHVVTPTDAGVAMSAVELQRELVRVRSPAQPPIYDNLGFGILGLVVADVLKVPYREAIGREIFAPLAMSQSVIGLPDDRVGDAAVGHAEVDGHAAPCAHVLIRTVGQGGGDLSTTALDMGRFMSALLTPGKLLNAATLRKMADFDSERLHPLANGRGLPLIQRAYAGRPAMGHDGEINGFTSQLILFPQSSLGVFVSMNGGPLPPSLRLSSLLRGGRAAGPDPGDTIDSFIEHFARAFVAPSVAPPSKRAIGPEVDAAQLAGTYFRHDATRHLLGRIFDTVSAMRIGVDREGRLTSSRCTPLLRKAPMYYECADPDGPVVAAFRVDGGRVWGGIGRADTGPPRVRERQPWWRTAPFAVLPVPLLIVLGLSALVRGRFERHAASRRVLLVAGACTVAFLVALLLELEFAYLLSYSSGAGLALVWRALFPLAAAGFVVNGFLAAKLVRAKATQTGPIGIARGTYLGAVTLAGLALVWLALLWTVML